MSAVVVKVGKRPRSSDRIEQRFPNPFRAEHALSEGATGGVSARDALEHQLRGLGLSAARARAYLRRIDACSAIPEGCQADALARIVSDALRAAQDGGR